MKRVGIREFRDHATRYLAGDEVLAIERHGEPVGFFIPSGATGMHSQEQFIKALERLRETAERVIAGSGLSEDDLSRLFDLTEPVPEYPKQGYQHLSESTAGRHASGR